MVALIKFATNLTAMVAKSIALSVYDFLLLTFLTSSITSFKSINVNKKKVSYFHQIQKKKKFFLVQTISFILSQKLKKEKLISPLKCWTQENISIV